jgi:DNA-binding NarL/FixJ family response regulator
VLVIDDHPVFRLGLAALVRGVPGVAQVVEADCAEAGIARWREGAYDLVTVDVTLPDGDGFSLARQAREERLSGRIYVISMHDDRAYRVRAKAEGASGYATKSLGAPLLVASIARCLAGEDTFEAPVDTAPSPRAGASVVTTESLSVLSPTEQRVVALLSRNLTSREMSAMLGSSVRTVENHRANICRKLELRGPHRLLEFALAAAPLLASLGSSESSQGSSRR